jgi:low temperature requirement protein LtrA
MAALQVGWVARLAVPDEFYVPSLLMLIAAELLVPVWAERAALTSWHPHHIAERYGLFTIIVLGETVLAASLAFQSGFDAGGGGSLLVLAGFGLVIVFGIWWLYFDLPGHERLEASRSAFLWGYGHYAIFASVAAVGAGLAVAADYDTHVSHLSRVGTGYAVAVPVAVFLLGVWALRLARVRPMLYPVTAALILVTPLTPVPVPLTAALLAGLVAMNLVPGRSAGRRSTAGADQSTG